MLKPITQGSRKNFYKLPGQSEWQSFLGTVRILQPDFFYYSEHRPELADGKTTFFGYCQASPPDGHYGKATPYEDALIPDGIDRCRAIKVPVRLEDGTIQWIPLHDSDGGGDVYFNVLVWDWASLSVKILSHGRDKSLADSLYRLWVREQETPLNELGDLVIQCSKQGSAWRYDVSTVSKPCGDINEHTAVIAGQYQAQGEGAIAGDFNPAMTGEEIQKRLDGLIESQNIPTPGQGASGIPGVQAASSVVPPPATAPGFSEEQANSILNAPPLAAPAFAAGTEPPTPQRQDVSSLPTEPHPEPELPSPPAFDINKMFEG